MRTFILKPGLVIDSQDHIYKLARHNLQGKAVFEDDQGETLVMSRKDFLRKYEEREIHIPKDQTGLGYIPKRQVASPDLSFYPKAHADEALRRRHYLDRLVDDSGCLPENGRLRKLISVLHTELGDSKKAPSEQTVRRWQQAYRAAGTTAGLLPQHSKKGRKNVIAGELENILENVLEEIWLKREKVPLTHVLRSLEARINDLNNYRAESQRLSIPSDSTVRRYIDCLDPEYVHREKKGKHAAAREFRSAIGTVNAKNLNNRWEIDHTPLDVLLVDDESGLVIGRPWLTVVIDRESRVVMGYLLHLLAPSLESVLRVLEIAIRPKDGLLAKFPTIKEGWPCHGMPLRIVPDNAAEFHAKNLRQGFSELGIEVLFPPSRSPKHKGAVERFFRTLAVDLIHTLPGTTFANTEERGDYPSEKLACLTRYELEKLILTWIVEIYHNKPHRSLNGKAPLQHWKALQSKRNLHLPADLDDLEAVLSIRAEREVFHYGVEISGIKYNCEELQRIYKKSVKACRIEVRYRDDLGHIWVKDQEDEVFIKVPAVDGRYVGMSRDLYQEARKQVKKNGSRTVSFEKMNAAYHSIRESAKEAKKSQKMRLRRNAAAISMDRGGNARNECAQESPPDEVAFSLVEIDRDCPVFDVIDTLEQIGGGE